MEEIKIKIIMHIKEFCDKAKNHSLIKGKYKIVINPDYLKEVGFLKKNYNQSDYYELNNILKLKVGCVITNLSKTEQKARDDLFKILFPDVFLIATGKKKDISLITLLKLVPDFKSWVDNIRKKYEILPKNLKGEIYQKFPKEKKITEELIETDENFYEDFLLKNKAISLADKKIFSLYLKEIEKSKKSREDIEAYIKEKFPKINGEIRDYCFDVLRLPSKYIKNLKYYVLFEKIYKHDEIPLKNYDTKPEIEVVYSPLDYLKKLKEVDTFEPHISLNIYGTTSLKEVKEWITLLWKKDIIKRLPSYNFKAVLVKQKRDPFFLKAIYYFLVVGTKLTHEEATNVARSLNMKTYPKEIITRELKRFRNDLKI